MMAGSQSFFKMNLRALLRGWVEIDAKADCTLSGLTLDSREVQKGDLFLACRGLTADGAEFIDAAIERGAAAVLWQPHADVQAMTLTYRSASQGQRVPVVAVVDLKHHAGFIAQRFYGNPSAAMFTVGITGTNGKTSVSQFLAHCLNQDAPSGVIGTLGHGLLDALTPSNHTTPDVVSVHRWLAQLREQGAASVAMEVSSHALDQGRIDAVELDCGVFTNLSRDHLDYHGDMARYGEAKRRLFAQPGMRYAVINGDDARLAELLHDLPDSLQVWRYGLKADADYPVRGEIVELSRHGMTLQVETPTGQGKLQSQLLGRFNASNLLAVLSVLLLHGVALETALMRLSDVPPVAGRMETFGGESQPLVVVDYAHTPDALQQVLQAVREHVAAKAKLICVFGCGGDRDKGKRAIMGSIAEKLADRVIITNDNPRDENPHDIVQDIQQGIKNPDAVYLQLDRREAIAEAIRYAAVTDIVVVAGKGHERWQIIGGQKRPFNDAAEVQHQLGGWQA